MNKLAILACGALCLALVGCESMGKKNSSDSANDPNAAALAAAERARLEAEALAAAKNKIPATKVIYFDYDRSEVKAESQSVVANHGSYLATHGNSKVTLEGHADERGSREYNIGLGERRAKAVEQMLVLQGVPAAQIDVISYGEERPASTGEGESSWSLNRRVEFVYP